MSKQNPKTLEILSLFWDSPPNSLFDQNVIATVLSRSPASLERSRWSGMGGPPFKKIMRSVRYEKQAVLNWLDGSTVHGNVI